MEHLTGLWSDPAHVLRALDPEEPTLCFDPSVLRRQLDRFRAGFPGMVTYAVKANPATAILQNLSAAGLEGYDVASIPEIALVRKIAPHAALHYNNPVRSSSEVRQALAFGVRSFSLDSPGELERLTQLAPPETELTVRFKLPVSGAAYDFGAKFGADPSDAITLLAEVAARGFVPSLTFHPGTQCPDPTAWRSYIAAAANIASQARTRPRMLNVGGGFPMRRMTHDHENLEVIFAAIDDQVRRSFGRHRPALVCEPGRAMVGESCSLLTRVRAVRDNAIFLNDGIYGALAEQPVMGQCDRVHAIDAKGQPKRGPRKDFAVFGPTCDSLDRLPGTLPLPVDLTEGDAVIFEGMGAYSGVTATRFNGFGALRMVTMTDGTVAPRTSPR